jgi:hypothetical protein
MRLDWATPTMKRDLIFEKEREKKAPVVGRKNPRLALLLA